MSAIAYFFIRLLELMVRALAWVCIKLRLGIPLLYVALMNTVFRHWAWAHEQLVDYILFAMIGIAAISWIVTGIRYIRGGSGRRNANDLKAQMIADQLNAAEEQGIHSLRFASNGSVIEE